MSTFLFSGLVVFSFFTLFFIIAQIFKDNSLVDIGWGLSFVVLAFSLTVLKNINNLSQILILTLITIWGLRLTAHIAKRNLGKGEDYRYVEMRKKWGNKQALNAFFKVFMLQAIFMYIVAMPIMLLFNYNGEVAGGYILAGLIIWLIGFLFESIGDYQLKQFIKNNKQKGEVITSGLWKYTRHPNYFGEAVMWWAYAVLAISVQFGILALVSPILITYLLVFVSGVPMLEKKLMKNPNYVEYAKKTSKFIPWFKGR